MAEATLPLDRMANHAVNRSASPGSRQTGLPAHPMHKAHPAMEFPDFGLTAEERRFAVRGHYYEYPGMDGERGEIWCYTDRFSYRPGEVALLHVSATAKSFTIRIVRDGGDRDSGFRATRRRFAAGRTRRTNARSKVAAGSPLSRSRSARTGRPAPIA